MHEYVHMYNIHAQAHTYIHKIAIVSLCARVRSHLLVYVYVFVTVSVCAFLCACACGCLSCFCALCHLNTGPFERGVALINAKPSPNEL